MAKLPGTSGRHRGPWTLSRVNRESWSTPWALGPGPKSPGTSGRTRRPSDPVSNHLGKLVDTARTRTQARLVQQSGSKPRSLGPGHESSMKAFDSMGTTSRARISRDSWSTPRDLGHMGESPLRTGRPHGHSDPGPSRPGYLVKPTGPRTRARVPGAAVRPCDPLDHGPNCLVQLVDTAGRRTWTRVTRERRSTPWALGPVPESPWKTFLHRGASFLGPSLPGQLVEPGGSPPRA